MLISSKISVPSLHSQQLYMRFALAILLSNVFKKCTLCCFKIPSSQTVLTGHLNSIQNPTQITFTKYIRIVTRLGSFLISFTYLGKGNLPGTHSYLQPVSPQISDKKLWRFFRRPSNTNQNCVLKWGSNT